MSFSLRWKQAIRIAFAVSVGLTLNCHRLLAQEPNPSEKGNFIQRPDDDLLLLSVHLDNLTLALDIEAYQYPGGVLLPLGTICQLLELAVTVSPQTGTAEGFIGRPDRRFSLDTHKGIARLAGKNLPFSRTQIERHRNDIYIDSQQLSAWFDLGLEVDVHAAAVMVNPTDPLPMQKRLARERQAAQARLRFSSYHDPGFPRVPNAYTRLSGPTIDQSLTINSLPASGTQGTSLRYTAQIAADVAHMGLNAFLTAESDHAITVSQLSLGQMDATGHLLGRLHANEVTVGQIYAPAVPLVSDSQLATELFISSYPLYQARQFDTTTLTGVLQPGWDVELYRDQSLIDYQQASDAGRYEFKNVPITFGNNRYRLVFYGPHGERQEEVRRFNVGDALVPPGKNRYRLAIQPKRSGDVEYTIEDDVGLRRNLSTEIGLTAIRLKDGLHSYGTIGLRGFTEGFLGYVHLVADPKTGIAQEMGVSCLWRSTTVAIKQTLVSGLVSQTLSAEVNPIQNRTSLRLGNIPLPHTIHLLPTDFEIVQERTRTGAQRWEWHDRLSYQRYGLGVTNWLTWQSSVQPSLLATKNPSVLQPTISIAPQAQESTTQRLSQGQGELLINQWHHNRLLQSQISYDWLPTLRFQQIALQTQKVLPDQRLQTLGLYYSLSGNNYGVTTALTRTQDAYSYGVSADLSTQRGLSLGMSISMGLLHNPSDGHWDTNAQSQIAHGAILARVYLDTNNNYRQDPGEPGIPGVEFFVNDMSYSKPTGKKGTVLIDNLTPFEPADLRVSPASLSNPLWIPAQDGVRIVPRSGNVPVVDFPIVSTGEVSGTVYDPDNQEATGITLELVDAKDQVLQKQITAYDGFYTFSHVPVGNFHIRVSPIVAARRGYTASEAQIQIPIEGGFLDGINITLVASPNPP